MFVFTRAHVQLIYGSVGVRLGIPLFAAERKVARPPLCSWAQEANGIGSSAGDNNKPLRKTAWPDTTFALMTQHPP
ncbi:MAG: hypothetical protein EOO70_02150 [Myxococcaceae bacterium]|nr:MAG: hypothetical protein EOO70_02150 [Myxococcaceae bacterium]